MEKEKVITGAEAAVEAPIAEQKSMRKYQEAIKARYPDANPQSDEEWQDLMDKYSEETGAENDKYKSTDTKITDKVNSDPELGQLLYDVMVNDMPIRAALAKLDIDLIPKEGDEDYEPYVAIGKQKAESASKRSAIDKEIEANQDASIAAIDAYCESKGYSEEQKTTLLDFVNNTFQDLLMKKVTEPILSAFDKAQNYENDIAAAAEAAKIEGKNEAIDIKKAKVASAETGDGIPQSGKGGATKERVVGPNQKLFAGLGERKGI